MLVTVYFSMLLSTIVSSGRLLIDWFASARGSYISIHLHLYQTSTFQPVSSIDSLLLYNRILVSGFGNVGANSK